MKKYTSGSELIRATTSIVHACVCNVEDNN